MIWIVLFIAAGATLIFLIMYLPGKSKKKDREPPPENLDELCVRVRDKIDALLLDTETDNEKERLRIMRAVREACLGDQSEREFLKDLIKSLIIEMLGDRYGRGNLFIPFDDPDKMNALMMFEHLYMKLASEGDRGVFARMVKKYGWNELNIITSEDIKKAYDIGPVSGNYNEMLDTLVQRVYELLYGHDCTDLLINDTSIDGVSAGVGGKTRFEYDYLSILESGENRASRSFDTVYCVYEGRTIRMRFLSFGNNAALERVVKNIYRYNSRAALSQKNPVIHATMKDNSRVMVSRPPVSDGYAFYVRKYRSSSPADIKSLLVHEGAEEVIEILTSLVRTEQSFCISGNTGGGKTTLLKALVAYIDPLYAIRVVESSFELDLNNLYPERNIHMLQERGEFSIYDAITATKKMDTDVLLIGEVNEPKVAGAFIQISQSGSRMAITTLHHETTKKLIEYMRNALMCEFGINDASVAEKQVVDSISYDVHMVRDTRGRHYVERITKIIPNDSQHSPFYKLVDLIVFDPSASRYVKTSFE
ncbi:MAG: CpaF/VirB11 family protein [Lachnospiraceae bacterium]|nr:CpaF/VirB11 family protein [Lachnospiraceae bacterium]